MGLGPFCCAAHQRESERKIQMAQFSTRKKITKKKEKKRKRLINRSCLMSRNTSTVWISQALSTSHTHARAREESRERCNWISRTGGTIKHWVPPPPRVQKSLSSYGWTAEECAVLDELHSSRKRTKRHTHTHKCCKWEFLIRRGSSGRMNERVT